MCGWDVPDAKSPPPSQCFRALGAIWDFTGFPSSPMHIRPAQDRLDSLKVLLGQVLTERRLSPSLAGKLYGKLMFMSSQYFGRLGRALLRAFSRRQHENIHVLNNQIEAACKFWITSMESLRPREIPVSLSSRPVYLSYSDGEGEGAGVGIALWCPDGKLWVDTSRCPWKCDRPGPEPHLRVITSIYSRSKQWDQLSSSTIGPISLKATHFGCTLSITSLHSRLLLRAVLRYYLANVSQHTRML